MLSFPLLLSSITLLIVLFLLTDLTSCTSALAHHVAVAPDNDLRCLGLTEGKITPPIVELSYQCGQLLETPKY